MNKKQQWQHELQLLLRAAFLICCIANIARLWRFNMI